MELLKSKLFKLRLNRARELKMENEMITFDTKEEIEKLIEILKKLRLSEGTVDAEALTGKFWVRNHL